MQTITTINQNSVEEFLTTLQKSFTPHGERQLNSYIERVRKGEIVYLPLIQSSLQIVPEDWIEKNYEKMINLFKALPETYIDPF